MKTPIARARPLVVETERLAWETLAPGQERKHIADAEDAGATTTFLVRLAAGATWPAPAQGLGREVLVLAGVWDTEDGPLDPGSYSSRPAAAVGATTSAAGCTLFVKEGVHGPGNQERVHLPGHRLAWVPGHGNLRVRPLHSFGTVGTALVHWPAGERFLPHTHRGGEEIFVLRGTFLDEHGRYPAGTWLRNPHMSSHHPFVEDETVIFVKTGHLAPPAG